MAHPIPLHSQRIHVEEDPVELMYARGVTDGLPVVPPTEDRVKRMLAAVDRDPQEVLGTVGPNYGRATLEKVAINAVMAGCHPSYFSTVIAAIEALSDEKFNAHAMNVTTFSATPLTIINGPVRRKSALTVDTMLSDMGFALMPRLGVRYASLS